MSQIIDTTGWTAEQLAATMCAVSLHEDPGPLRRGDRVHCKTGPLHDVDGDKVPGIVLRVAKDGSWADVDWLWWHKRMPQPSLVRLT